MKFLLALIVIATFAQSPGDTASPFQTRVEPPEYPQGVACSHAGVMAGNVVIDPDHKCVCRRMNDSETCDDPNYDTHDPQCSQWCHEHKDHCHCAVECVLPGSLHSPVEGEGEPDPQ